MEYVIGIDLGGTAIKYALVDQEGRVSFQGKLPSLAHVSAAAVLDQLVQAAQTVWAHASASANISIKGLGLGTPGIVDETNRIVLGGAENIVGWECIDVASALENRLQLPVILGNDANLMGLGESRFGAGRGCSDVVFLTIGTGIGGAVVMNGQLFNGYANRGTELGHVPLIANGEKCACGATGCLEHYASTAALVRRFTDKAQQQGVLFDRPVDGELIVKLYHQGVPAAVECMKEHFYFLGRGIAGFVNIFSPQRVVLGGGIVSAGDFYVQELRKVVRREVIADCAVHTEIVPAALGNNAGLIGAASLWF